MESKRKAIKALKQWIKIQKQVNLINFKKREDAEKEILKILKDLKEKTTILICGEFNAGKSTFINAILGEKILTSAITPATAIITKITYGSEKKVVVHLHNGKMKEYDFSSLGHLTAEGDQQNEDVRLNMKFVELQLPFELLKYCTLIDSPGLTSLYQQHTDATSDFFEQADAAIWLFNSMNVGTASEMVWLKTLNELKIPTFGLVNSIDRLDEDEDLEAFYEYNLRRLNPFITHLDGISAKDILEGKLTDNSQLKEWGNLSVIDELFLKFEEQKIDKYFQSLKSPLQKLYDSLHKQKRISTVLRNREDLLKGIRKVAIDAVEIKNSLISVKEEKKQTLLEWTLYIESNVFNPMNILPFLNRFNESEKLVIKWEQLVQPHLKQYLKRFQNINLEGKILGLKQTVTEENYDKINGVYFKILQTYKYYKAVKEYNVHLEMLQLNMNFLKEDHKEVEKSLEQYKEILHQTIAKEFEIFDEKIEKNISVWNEFLSPLKMPYGNWNFKDLLSMELHVEEVKIFQKEVLPHLLAVNDKHKSLSSFLDIEILVSQINGLYKEETEKELLKNMFVVDSLENHKNYNFSIKTFETQKNTEDYFDFNLTKLKEQISIEEMWKLAPQLMKDPAVVVTGVGILMSVF